MRVLIAHSFYRVAGGEDGYVRHQLRLLGGRAEVHLLSRRNASLGAGAYTAARMATNPALRRRLRQRMLALVPDVVHLHNPYPAFGPSVHQAARDVGAPLVQTVHNVRLRCPNGLEFTEGEVCRRCNGGAYQNAVTHACFPDRRQAAGYASALWYHRFVLHLEDAVDLYIAPSEYVRSRLADWGIAPSRIALIRHATDLPLGKAGGGDGGAFVGRLSAEKGLPDLLEALALLGDPPFRIVGHGPQEAELRAQAGRLGLRRTVFSGWADRRAVGRIVAAARMVVVPSVWEEVAGLSAIEAMARGRPVVVTRTGGLPELVGSGAGIAVPPGSPAELAGAMAVYFDDPARAEIDGSRGLAFVEAEATPARHADALVAAYRDLANRRLARAAEASTDADPVRPAVHGGSLRAHVGRALVVIQPAAPTVSAQRVVPAPEAATIAPATDQPGPAAHQPTPPADVAGSTATIAPAAIGVPASGRQPLHVLMAHSYYRELGGENLSFEAEVELLRANGHRVTTFTRDNLELLGAGFVRRARAGLGNVWSLRSVRDVTQAIRDLEPDVVHFQNTMPLISPAAIRAAHDMGVPVVVALRNYRAACAKGTLFRDGAVCEDCLTRTIPWPGVVHGCYRSSHLGAAAVAAGITTHRLLGTWQRFVDAYVAPSLFARDKLIEAGFPAQVMHVKPNFVDPDPGFTAEPGEIALFAGRLSQEKGVLTLLEAWCRRPPLPLVVVGDGPLLDTAHRFVADHGLHDTVSILGSRPHADVMRLMAVARVAIFPSEWYETFGRVFAEAYACGVPVVAARLGTALENVEDGVTGRLYQPSDAADLAAAVEFVLADPARERAMRRAARATFEARFTAARNIGDLLEIYDVAAEHRRRVVVEAGQGVGMVDEDRARLGGGPGRDPAEGRP